MKQIKQKPQRNAAKKIARVQRPTQSKPQNPQRGPYMMVKPDQATLNSAQVLAKMTRDTTRDNYAKSVLLPENTRGGRVPTRFPVPTATMHHYEKFDITTNDLGQCVAAIYPTDISNVAKV